MYMRANKCSNRLSSVSAVREPKFSMLQAASLAFSIAFSRTLLFAEANDYLEFYLFQSASTHAIGGSVYVFALCSQQQLFDAAVVRTRRQNKLLLMVLRTYFWAHCVKR
jgi:hypothetical protein